MRTCVQGTCTEDLYRSVPCEREICVVYSDWTIGSCSATCGSGVRRDRRTCVQGRCTESLDRTVPCEREVCVVYSDWVIGSCSVTCGSGALKALIGPFHVRQKPVSSTVSGSWVNAAPLAELESKWIEDHAYKVPVP